MRKLLIGLTVPLALAAAAPAFAHSTLVDGSPGPGAEVAPGVEVVALKFDAALDPDAEHTVVVRDADDEPLPISDAITASDPTYVCAAVAPMEAGVHSIQYDVTSDDGHAMRGKYEFEVVEGGEQADPMACDPSALGEPEEAKNLEDSDDFPVWALWVLGGVVVLSAALAAVAIARSRRETDAETDADTGAN